MNAARPPAPSMTLALRLARRELRGGLSGFRILLACLALGVAAIAGVGSLSASLRAGMTAHARELLGGDVELRQLSPTLPPRETAFLNHLGRVARSTEMRAMVRTPAGRARSLVELKAVDGAYPLFGRVALAPEAAQAQGLAWALAPAQERGAPVFGAAADPGLLTRLGLKVGDTLRLGAATLVVRATIVNEPDRLVRLFSLGPRLMISQQALAASGLVQPGSLLEEVVRVALTGGETPGAAVKALRAAFPDAPWRIRTSDQPAPGLDRFLTRAESFLTLAGLAALLLGGIGVGNAVAAYLSLRAPTIATLKALGASSGLIFRVYLIQILALAGLGLLAGVALGAALPWAVALAAAQSLPVAPALGLYPAPLAKAALFGLLTALVFAIGPLLRARDTHAAALLRGAAAPPPTRRQRLGRLATTLGGLLLLALLVPATSPDPVLALKTVLAAALAALAFLTLAALTVRLARRLKPRRIWLKLALAHLARPQGGTAWMLLSLGLGLSLLAAVSLIQDNLDRQIATRIGGRPPALFFIDIPQSGFTGFESLLARLPDVTAFRLVPALRARITRLNGLSADQAKVAPDARWAVRHDRVVTWAGTMPPGTRLTAGAWWPADWKGAPLVSLDARLAQGFGLKVGDTLGVRILGRDITARIANLRDIDWTRMHMDFVLIFSPHVLDGAPYTGLAAVHVRPGGVPAVEKAATDAFPGASAIQVASALAAAQGALESIGALVRAVAALALAAGLLVLGGASAAAREARLAEAVLLKVLGASRRQLWAAHLAEHACLGALAGVLALGLGGGGAWWVVARMMDLPWHFNPLLALGLIALGIALAALAGFAATYFALKEKPSPYLRNRQF